MIKIESSLDRAFSSFNISQEKLKIFLFDSEDMQIFEIAGLHNYSILCESIVRLDFRLRASFEPRFFQHKSLPLLFVKFEGKNVLRFGWKCVFNNPLFCMACLKLVAYFKKKFKAEF